MLLVNTITVQNVFDILAILQVLETYADAGKWNMRRSSIADLDEVISETKSKSKLDCNA